MEKVVSEKATASAETSRPWPRCSRRKVGVPHERPEQNLEHPEKTETITLILLMKHRGIYLILSYLQSNYNSLISHNRLHGLPVDTQAVVSSIFSGSSLVNSVREDP
jgi:hypothetical protein